MNRIGSAFVLITRKHILIVMVIICAIDFVSAVSPNSRLQDTTKLKDDDYYAANDDDGGDDEYSYYTGGAYYTDGEDNYFDDNESSGGSSSNGWLNIQLTIRLIILKI
jgi:hypothetical protein